MKKIRLVADEELINAVKQSESYASVLKILKFKISGSAYALIKLKIRKLNLDISHFTGKGWCKDEKHKNFINKHLKIPLEKILVKDSNYQNTHTLKKRLIREKLLKNECYECSLKPEWNGKLLSLQLDHKDGDRSNNLLENLRLLCPNCHSQTDTFAGKSKRKKGQVTELADVILSKSIAI